MLLRYTGLLAMEGSNDVVRIADATFSAPAEGVWLRSRSRSRGGGQFPLLQARLSGIERSSAEFLFPLTSLGKGHRGTTRKRRASQADRKTRWIAKAKKISTPAGSGGLFDILLYVLSLCLPSALVHTECALAPMPRNAVETRFHNCQKRSLGQRLEAKLDQGRRF